jgi:cytoplasmic iron level regulating protein YaaA (DUF328/UPF0246 family)
MLTVISPAKRLDWTVREVEMTTPAFQDEAEVLARAAKRLSQAELASLMDLSPDLAKLNADRFRRFAEDKDDIRPAALAFAGDTYQGLEAATLDDDALRYAQDHLRILSGLYGLLRPLDGIQAYRLEMGSRLKTRKGPNLYAYWGDRLARALNDQAQAVARKGADQLRVGRIFLGGARRRSEASRSSPRNSSRTSRAAPRSSASSPRRRAARWPASSSNGV